MPRVCGSLSPCGVAFASMFPPAGLPLHWPTRAAWRSACTTPPRARPPPPQCWAARSSARRAAAGRTPPARCGCRRRTWTRRRGSCTCRALCGIFTRWGPTGQSWLGGWLAGRLGGWLSGWLAGWPEAAGWVARAGCLPACSLLRGHPRGRDGRRQQGGWQQPSVAVRRE